MCLLMDKGSPLIVSKGLIGINVHLVVMECFCYCANEVFDDTVVNEVNGLFELREVVVLNYIKTDKFSWSNFIMIYTNVLILYLYVHT